MVCCLSLAANKIKCICFSIANYEFSEGSTRGEATWMVFFPPTTRLQYHSPCLFFTPSILLFTQEELRKIHLLIFPWRIVFSALTQSLLIYFRAHVLSSFVGEMKWKNQQEPSSSLFVVGLGLKLDDDNAQNQSAVGWRSLVYLLTKIKTASFFHHHHHTPELNLAVCLRIHR